MVSLSISVRCCVWFLSPKSAQRVVWSGLVWSGLVWTLSPTQRRHWTTHREGQKLQQSRQQPPAVMNMTMAIRISGHHSILGKETWRRNETSQDICKRTTECYSFQSISIQILPAYDPSMRPQTGFLRQLEE